MIREMYDPSLDFVCYASLPQSVTCLNAVNCRQMYLDVVRLDFIQLTFAKFYSI